MSLRSLYSYPAREQAPKIYATRLKLISFLNQDTEIIEAINRNATDETLVISIGGACLSAVEIYRLGLRKAAYPFDVIFSELDGVIKAIETDFIFFTDPNYLTRKFFINIHHVFNTIYKFIFPHDLVSKTATTFDINDISLNFNDFQEKYKRRIERFKNLKNFTGKVYFLRTYSKYIETDTQEKLIDLKNIIQKKFPKLKFEIIVVNPISVQLPEKDIDNIKYFYINNFSLSSKETENDFYNIFQSLSITTNPIKLENFFNVVNR